MTTPSTLARLAKELNGYTDHDHNCLLNGYDGASYSRKNCTCGLTALQQQLAEELAKGEAP